MSATTELKIWTDEEFLNLPGDEQYELVDGALIDMGNSGMAHGELGSFLGGSLSLYVRSRKLGVVCDSSTAFSLKSGNKRSPDVSFVAKERLEGLKSLPRGFFQGSPDLAVEILSPNNTVEEVHNKIVEYFENETRLIWVVHPDEQFVLVYHTVRPDRLLQLQDSLDGEDIVPGFSLPMQDLFADWEF